MIRIILKSDYKNCVYDGVEQLLFTSILLMIQNRMCVEYLSVENMNRIILREGYSY